MGDNKETGRKVMPEYASRRSDLLHRYILNNFSMKLLSFFGALLVWIVIINIEDPIKEKSFVVEVQTINEDALSSVNKVYEIIEGDRARVRVRGKKSIVDKLQASDIQATANLADLSAVNAVAIVPELKKKVSVKPELSCTQVLRVSLENMESKQVKVTVLTEGEPQDGFSVGDCTARPNMIEVSGGESVVKKIDSVCVKVNVNGTSENFVKKALPKAYDINGEEVTSSTLRFSVTRVRVNVHVLNTKSIPVKIKISGEPAAGYEFVGAECQPEKIEVAGTVKELNELDSVEIPIDITGMKSASGFVEQNISIQDYLPEGISVQGDYAQVSLRIAIEKLMKKTITIPVDRIMFSSLGSNYSAVINGEETAVAVKLQGRSSVLDELTEDSYTAYVDCEGLSPGRYDLKVLLDIGDSFTVVRSTTVKVQIRKNSLVDDDGDEDAETISEPASVNIPGEISGTESE